MGRRRDDPRDQRDKGHPGRRKSKTVKAIEAMERAAAKDAKLFADNSNGGNLQALPIFLEDKRLAAAQVIWREYAPRLDKLWLLSTLDRTNFAMFCIYAAEFVLANKDILDNGYTIMVTTVAGQKSKSKTGTQMPRLNPSVDRRDHAAKMMLDLSEKFGFTPLDRHKLIAMRAMNDDQETLFGAGRAGVMRTAAQSDAPAPEGAGGTAPSAASEPIELIGALSRLDSPGPGKLNS